jgi:hypothetical protein
MMQYENRSSIPDRAVDDASSAETLTWDDVFRLARHGNPPPPRRVEKTDAQWRALLTDEQFRITRLKETERAHSSAMCFRMGLNRTGYGSVSMPSRCGRLRVDLPETDDIRRRDRRTMKGVFP